MPIQFVCRSCNQPVEIDDEYAGQQVVCPFCEAVLTAPHESNFVPTRSQVARPGSVAYGDMRVPPAPPGAEYGYMPPPLSSNRFGNIGLVLALFAWAVIVGQVVYATTKAIAIAKLDLATASQDPDYEAKLQAAVRDIQTQPAHRSVRNSLAVMTLGAGLLGLASMLLGIVAMTRQNARKGTAVAALLLSIPQLMCLFISMIMNSL